MSAAPASSPHAWRDHVVASFRQELDQMIEQREITTFTEGSAAEAVRASTRGMRETSWQAKQYGSFFTTSSVAERLGNVSRQAIAGRVERDTLLRVTTRDGRQLYPAYQVTDGTVPGPMKRVLKILLPAAPDPWVVVHWMTSPLEDFDGRTAVQVIDEGDWRELKYLYGLAQDEAAGWRDR